MAYELPALPFEMNALEPFISKETLEYHYGKHHAAYVKNLNGLVPGTEFENSGLEEIIKKADGGVFNNGAQVWNHTFYWNCMAPDGGGEPTGALMNAIKSDFGSFDAFKEQFSKAAATLFGSGWAWLVKTPAGKLEIVQESNAGNPLRNGLEPIMTCDVWEHAYYIDKRNMRPAYIEDFWKVIDWNTIANRL
ncbi:MAG: superoxide dismutase [Fe] [Bacteroidetes bacterium]|nr:MAG: superoxide dismutase [Fe] [Bacteroidota bacterium]